MQIEKEDSEKLYKAINSFKKHNFFKMYDSIWRLLAIYVLKGLASGLGWVIGATLLVSILTFILSQIEFMPIIGEWVSKLIQEIEEFVAVTIVKKVK